MNILYEKTTEGSIDEVGARLEQAAQNHAFGVLGTIDIRQKMADKGIEFGPGCRIYEVCNPQRAKDVLDKDITISTALPCRISVFEKEGKTKVSTLLPTVMLNLYDQPELSSVAREVEDDIKAIMDEAAGE
jgi:uncharacterized protein (DUF302 family)